MVIASGLWEEIKEKFPDLTHEQKFDILKHCLKTKRDTDIAEMVKGGMNYFLQKILEAEEERKKEIHGSSVMSPTTFPVQPQTPPGLSTFPIPNLNDPEGDDNEVQKW